MAQKHKADYFLKDFGTIRQEMLARLPVISEGKLTDLNESSVGVTFVEIFAAIADMLAFYLDSSVLEAFLPTARQPENIYRLTDLIGYNIRETTSARAKVKFSISSALSEEVYIPKHTLVGTSLGGGSGSSGLFTTTEPTTIPIGSVESDFVEVVQGSLSSSTFLSDGTANQIIRLETLGLDPSTIEVKTGSTKWDKVETFLYSTSEDFVFRVKTDYNGITRIYFGDGKYGRVPAINEQITVSFLSSAGDKGNVGANAISLVISEVRTVTTGRKVENISVANPDAAAGGSSRQSLNQVKINAPGSLSALYRPLTKYDYSSLIARLGGIQHVNVWGEQEEDPPSYENMNWVNICLVPVGGGLPSQNLKSTVEDYLLSLQPITVRIRFIEPEFRYFNFNISVKVTDGYSKEQIRIQITDAIREYLALENVRFGQDLRSSNFYKLVLDVEGVDHVFIDPIEELNDDETTTVVGNEVVLQKWQIPQLGYLTVSTSVAVELPIPDLYPDETI